MRLYLDIDRLSKAGSTPPGAGPKPASVPQTRMSTSPPKTPGAATGSSAPQVVDCPLGAACPKGGKHQAGSQTLQEHTKLAQSMGQNKGAIPGDESKGEPTAKPGVNPDSQNIGSVGSDQARKPPVVGDNTTQVNENDLKTQGLSKPAAKDTVIADYNKDTKKIGFNPKNTVKTGEPGADSVDDGRETITDFSPPDNMEGDARGPKKKQAVAAKNPLAYEEESDVPEDSDPMDHYRLSKVSRDMGDEDTAAFHEDMAKKRMVGKTAQDHRKLASQLRKEGFDAHADHHDKITDRVAELDAKHKDLEKEAKQKGERDLFDANFEYSNSKVKLDELKESNKKKLEDYKEAKAKWSKDKEGEKPQKPKLDKEPKLAEGPELSRPKSDHDKLKHESHTEKAKRVADIAASHLKHNDKLSPADRRRIERAHQVAVHNANIPHTPTATHKSELAEAEGALKLGGHNEHFEETQKAEAQKQQVAKQKQQEKENKLKAKQDAVSAKNDAKKQDTPIQNEMDQAKASDHHSKKEKLKNTVQQHLDSGTLSPQDQKKAQAILDALEQHEDTGMLPSEEKQNHLKELSKISGEMSKPPDPEGVEDYTGPTGVDSAGDGSFNALGMAHGLGQQLANAEVSNRGAGQLFGSGVSYGISGASVGGHHGLLKDNGPTPEELNNPKEAAAPKSPKSNLKKDITESP
jgi:hypothetical protein